MDQHMFFSIRYHNTLRDQKCRLISNFQVQDYNSLNVVLIYNISIFSFSSIMYNVLIPWFGVLLSLNCTKTTF